MPRLYAQLAARYGNRRPHTFSRRDMLKATLAASAGLLISGPGFGFLRAGAAGKRVVVVGAGFGGLACAHELKAAGYDVTVVEARNRVGGRVLSFGDWVKGRNVEGGGELIGSNHPTWVSYASDFNLEFLDVTEDENLYAPIVLDGKVLSEEEGNALWEELDAAANQMNSLAEPVNADEPWKSPDAAEIDKKTVQQWIDGLEVSELCKKAMRIQFAADNGVEPNKQSLLGMLAAVKGGGGESYWADSEVYRCKGGNQQLAQKLVESIGADRVVLRLPVTDITSKGSTMVVTCADGRTLECDDVVLAVPPSTWSRISFKPGLPAGLKPQMGTNVKYLAHVKSRFWKAAGLAPDCMTDTEVSMTWEGTDNQAGDENVVLNCFSGAAAAEKCRSRQGDAVKAAYAAELEKIYPGFGENFVESRFMDWPSEQWTGAGYSFPAPGEVTTVGPKLRSGVGRLHFAGEHCCYAFVGYMEGGLNAGAALARRLAVRDGVLEPAAAS